ncbi:MAG: hypothetical protein ACHQSE_03665 [Gemmatimonadales bacterium]
MKTHPDRVPAGRDSFSGDLNSRLELVHDRVGAESVHLDQVAAVAESYVVPLPPALRLVR